MPEPLIYTPAEVMEILQLGRSTVYDRLRDGTIPAVRVGRRLLIPRRALREMLEGESVPDPPDTADDDSREEGA